MTTFLLDAPPAPAIALALRRASASLSWERLLRLLDERERRRRRFVPSGALRDELAGALSFDLGGQQTCGSARERNGKGKYQSRRRGKAHSLEYGVTSTTCLSAMIWTERRGT